jgi:hypothetical protein
MSCVNYALRASTVSLVAAERYWWIQCGSVSPGRRLRLKSGSGCKRKLIVRG